MATKKGQYFSFDAVIASIIFVLALTSLLSYWNSTRNTFELQNSDMMKEAIRIGDSIFSPGSPENAACQAQEPLGFAVSWVDSRLSGAQVDCAVRELAGNSLKKSFSTQYGTSIYFEFGSGETKLVGKNIASLNLRNIVKIRRIASVINAQGREELASVDIYVYQCDQKEEQAGRC